MRNQWDLALSLVLSSAAGAHAEVKTKTITYEYGGVRSLQCVRIAEFLPTP